MTVCLGCSTTRDRTTYAESDYPDIPAVHLAVNDYRKRGFETTRLQVRSVTIGNNLWSGETNLWRIWIERLPRVPGGHAEYYVSQDDRVIRVVCGK